MFSELDTGPKSGGGEADTEEVEVEALIDEATEFGDRGGLSGDCCCGGWLW